MKMKKTKARVEWFLRNRPELRDNDFALMAEIWKQELNVRYPLGETLNGFLYDFSRGGYTHPESIRRTRAQLQKEDPSLRGERYQQRITKLEQQTREELGY